MTLIRKSICLECNRLGYEEQAGIGPALRDYDLPAMNNRFLIRMLAACDIS